MKTAYICSRYRATSKEQFELQLQYTKDLAREQILRGNNVIVPHLYYPQFLDDNCEIERDIGMKSAIDLMMVCDFVVIGIKYGISEGMAAEIAIAKENNFLIVRGDSDDW